MCLSYNTPHFTNTIQKCPVHPNKPNSTDIEDTLKTECKDFTYFIKYYYLIDLYLKLIPINIDLY